MAEQNIGGFEAERATKGYDAATKSMDPAMQLDDHTHDFDVRGLVTSGEISITVDGETRRYRVGDQFTMAAGCVHSEVVGRDGVTFIVGRLAPQMPQ